jgi:hypothetical protein
VERSKIVGGVERSDKNKRVLSFEESRHSHAGRSHKNG